MAARKGGTRRKTRHKLMKTDRARGKVPVTRYLQHFEPGDSVRVLIESSVHQGFCHPRFHGKDGKVIGMQGRCYYVQIHDGGKGKTLLVHPVHLEKVRHGQTTSA